MNFIVFLICIFLSFSAVSSASVENEGILDSLIQNKTHLDPVYMQLSSWERNKTFRGGVGTKNRRATYSFKNKNKLNNYGVGKKAVKLQFEEELFRYLDDPDFSCRMPALNAFFNHNTKLNKRCSNDNLPYILSSDRSKLRFLDKSRVYAIHYFLGAQGDAMMSRWGHTMLRIVVCSPERKEVSEACMEDTSHHLFLSFRADVTDVNINTFKGLTGGYKSRVFFHTFNENINEYLVSELRDLYSLPLNLNKLERELVLGKLFQDYWTYENDYEFLNRNCATEMADVLSVVLLFRGQDKIDAITPTGLYDALINSGLGDESKIQQKNALKLGYVIKSRRSWYSNTENYLKEQFSLNLNVETLIAQTRPEKRIELYNKLLSGDKETDNLLRAHFIILEKRAQFETTLRIKNFIVNKTLLNRNDNKDIQEKYENARNLGGGFNQIDNIAYGIPTIAEWNNFNGFSLDGVNLLDFLDDSYKEMFKDAMESHQRNLDTLFNIE